MKAKTDWAKSVRVKMIELNLSVNELASEVGFTREYTSSIINERVMSDSARKTISDYLNIPND